MSRLSRNDDFLLKYVFKGARFEQVYSTKPLTSERYVYIGK